MAVPPSNINLTTLVPHIDDGFGQPRRTRRPVATTAALNLSSLVPEEELPPPSGSNSPGRQRAVSPPPLSSLSISPPLVPEPTVDVPVPSLKSPSGGLRYYSEVARQAQTAGIAASHITGNLAPHVVTRDTSWVPEMRDGAGMSSQQAARHAVNAGGPHFFGQPIIAKGGGLAPFHGARPANEYSRAAFSGHFEAGSGVELRDTGTVEIGAARPHSRRGRRDMPAPPPHAAHEEGPPAHAPLTPGRVRQSATHRETFDGRAMQAVIYGGAS